MILSIEPFSKPPPPSPVESPTACSLIHRALNSHLFLWARVDTVAHAPSRSMAKDAVDVLRHVVLMQLQPRSPSGAKDCSKPWAPPQRALQQRFQVLRSSLPGKLVGVRARFRLMVCVWASIGRVWTRHLAPAAPASRPSLPTQFLDCACHSDSALQFLSLPFALDGVRVGLPLQGSGLCRLFRLSLGRSVR